MKLIRISIDITCKNGIAKTLEFYGLDGRKVQARARWIFPNIWRYQSLELKTMVGNFQPEQLDMSTSVLRWIARDLIKNFSFFLRALVNTYRFDISINEISQLPILVSSTSGGSKIWVSRHSLFIGLKPSDLEGTLEEERLKNPNQFSAMIRMAKLKSDPSDFTYEMHEETEYSLQQIDTQDNREPQYYVESENLVDAQIFHARVVVQDSLVLQMSNKRSPLLPRSPGFIDEFDGRYRTFRFFHSDLAVDSALYFGTSTNWFHFIVELAARVGGVPRATYEGKPIILEVGAHRNVLELCRLITGVDPIQVAVGQRVRIANLTVLREFGVNDPIDSIQRAVELKEFARIIVEQVPGPVEKSSSRVFFRRAPHLYRPLQNERQVAEFLEARGFESVYPEQFTLKEFISLLKGAEFVIAESGAAITNMMFATPGTHFLEIVPALVTQEFWSKFLKVYEMEYVGIQGEISRVGPKGYAFDGYKISLEKLSEVLNGWNI